MNYVSHLFEKCAKAKLNPPNFGEDKDDTVPGQFKVFCSHEPWKVYGVGYTKKSAKQQAAKMMISKLKEENLFEEPTISTNNAVAVLEKINCFCSMKTKDLPIFDDKGKEGDWFVVECKLEEFTGEGRGKSKKEAKQNAAEQVANHFGIHDFYEKLKKNKEEKEFTKNSIQLLHELCQKLNVSIIYTEQNMTNNFVITCTVGESQVNSIPHFSKKAAKADAADKMLKELKEKRNNFKNPSSPLKIFCEDFPQKVSSSLKPDSTLLKDTMSNTEQTFLSPETSDASKENATALKRSFPSSFFSDEEDEDEEPSKKVS